MGNRGHGRTERVRNREGSKSLPHLCSYFLFFTNSEHKEHSQGAEEQIQEIPELYDEQVEDINYAQQGTSQEDQHQPLPPSETQLGKLQEGGQNQELVPPLGDHKSPHKSINNQSSHFTGGVKTAVPYPPNPKRLLRGALRKTKSSLGCVWKCWKHCQPADP